VKGRCQETTDNLKQTNVSFNNKFHLNSLQLIIFWLIYVTMNIQNVLLWLECRHGDVCTTDQCHRPLQLTYQSDAASNHPHSAFFSGRLASPDLIMKGIEVSQGSSMKYVSSYGSLTLLHFQLGGSNNAQNVRDTASGKITTNEILHDVQTR